MKKVLIEMIALSTPRGRLLLFAFLSLIVFLVPIHFFPNLSVWQRLGWDSAPSVGLTRAFRLLLHGEFSAAWQRNWLIYPVCVVVSWILILDILKVRNSRLLSAKDIH